LIAPDSEYHSIVVPVAVKSAIVGVALVDKQND